MAKFNFNEALALANEFQGMANELNNADRIKLAGFLIGLVNAVQQTAKISRDAMWHAREQTLLFRDVEKDDPLDAGYHLHTTLETLGDDFDTLAEIVEQEEQEDPLLVQAWKKRFAEQEQRAAALAKLTDAEKALLGLAQNG